MNIKYYYLIISLLLITPVFGQNKKQQKMEQLSFMVGEWIGTSKIYKDGVVSKEGTAYQKINYDLSKNLLVIELNTEFLQLHTIIYYDTEDDTYYYYPFSKRGVSKYPALYKDKKFIVKSSEKNRFVFGRTKDGGFREYGEKLINGKWTIYFEDVFKNSQ